MEKTEDGKANLREFVQGRLRAIDADQLIPGADQALIKSGSGRLLRPPGRKPRIADADQTLIELGSGRMSRSPGRKPRIAVISRPGENRIGDIHIRYAQASEYLVDCLREAGASPVIIPETNYLEDIPLHLGLDTPYDGVVVPGTDWSDLSPEWYGEQNTGVSENTDQKLDRFDMAVILWCTLVQPIPFLSMCLGFQAWNVAMGGSLYQDLVKQRGSEKLTLDHSRWEHGPEAEHQVIIDGNSQLYHALGRVKKVQTNTLHHQGIREVAPGLIAVAHSYPDWVPEAIGFDRRWAKALGLPSEFALGTQFHPEIGVTDRASAAALNKIIPAFVRAASQAARKRR